MNYWFLQEAGSSQARSIAEIIRRAITFEEQGMTSLININLLIHATNSYHFSK